MSQQTHTITLKAVDGTTVVFERIGQSAQAAAAQITSAGQKATAALNQEAVATEKAAASTTKLGSAAAGAAKGIGAINAAARGAAFATFLGFLSDASRAAAEDEAAFARLEAAVDATGASYNDSARSIDAHITAAQRLGFADDAAADAIATMTAQTQDATKAQDNLGLAMDFARGKNISLGTAATVVGKVAAGNTAILTRYGIVLDENATSTEALAALQERFGGQAEAFAQTQGGAIARVQENLDNLVESIGGALGPMQTWLAILPGVSAGMSLAGGAAGALKTALFGVAEAEEAVAAAGAGSRGAGLVGLLGSINPAVAIVGLAAAGFVTLAKNISDYEAAASAAVDPTDTLREALINLQTAGLDTEQPERLVTAWENASTRMANAAKISATAVSESALTGPMAEFDSGGAQQVVDANRDIALSVEQRAQVEADLNTILGNSGPNREKAIDDTVELLRSYDGINSTAPGVAAGIHTIATSIDTYSLALERAVTPASHLRTIFEFMAEQQPGIHAGLSAATTDLINFADAYEANVNRLNALTAPSLATGAGFGADTTDLVTPEATRQAGAAIAAAHEAEAASAELATQKAQEHAAALQAEQDAAVQAADALIGSADSRAQAALRAAEAEEQYGERVADINSNLSDTLSNLEQSYGDTVASIQEQRVEGEQAAADAMKQINEDRRDVAVKAEQDIADVASQRQRVMADADRQSQDAARQFAEQQEQTADAQAAVRDKLNAATAAATDTWHEAVQQSIEQQRQIRTDLAAAIADVERAFAESTDQAQQDMQRLAEDHRIAMAGFATDEKRIKQDLQLVLKDPRATAEQKNAAELQARRQLQDLDRQREAEGLSHERSKRDIQEQQQQAAEDAARKEAELRQQAREQQQQADEERARAQAQYQQAVSQANQQAQQQLASIADQQQQAADQYQQQRQDIARQEAAALDDLATREQEIIDARAQSYQDLAEKRRSVEEDLAKREQELDQQTAAAAQQYNQQVADAQDSAAKARMAAQEQYANATKSDMTELQRLRDEGLITEGEYKKIYDDLIVVQDLSRQIEEEKELSALRQLDTQKQLLEIELQKAKAAAKGKEEPPDPLDTPPGEHLKALGGMARGRTLVGESGAELAIRGGRMWEVGAHGPEWVTLASGTMIMPHGAAQARMRGMALGGHMTSGVPQIPAGRTGRASGASIINNYGSITIKVDNADVGAEIARYLSGQNR